MIYASGVRILMNIIDDMKLTTIKRHSRGGGREGGRERKRGRELGKPFFLKNVCAAGEEPICVTTFRLKGTLLFGIMSGAMH